MVTPQIPVPKLAQIIGAPEIYFKREDLHKFGSHKGRSIPLMIKKYFKEGIKNFVISSSGNAALTTLIFVQNHNQNNEEKIFLQIFIGQKIQENKLKKILSKIKDPKIELKQISNPKQTAFKIDKSGQAKFLRQSTDDLALFGYSELAKELSHIPNLSAVFIPTSSGTTAQALGEEFKKLNLPIQIHIVQTEACHPIAQIFDKNFTEEKTSIAGAIVDKIAHRKEKLIEIIKQTNGFGWVINDNEIKLAQELTKENAKINISGNSALSVAGLKKAVENGWKWNGPVVCLITGE